MVERLFEVRHNYMKRILEMARRGEITAPLGMLDVYHDDWCAVFSGGYCNCDPEIVYVPAQGPEREVN